MQASRIPTALLTRISTPSPNSELTASPSRSAVIGALFAPAAMLVGALGLGGLWAASPRPSFPTDVTWQTPARLADTSFAVSKMGSDALSRWLLGLGAPTHLIPPASVTLTRTADQAVAELKQAEASMITAADLDARARLSAMRATFRRTGLDIRPYLVATNASPAGISRAEWRNPSLLAARLDVDPALARQMQQTARDLIAARTLGQAAAALPLATPVDTPVMSSPFGARTDPFTGHLAFHPGQDFAGHYGEPIHVTAPGVISFVGQRSGYGNCVEVDHGFGFKTRYGHLSGFTLGVGTPVKTGDVIGRMGSTGRSTGVHLHYEVWASGRLLNPTPFLQAGTPAAERG